jgi:hypothetical protein
VREIAGYIQDNGSVPKDKIWAKWGIFEITAQKYLRNKLIEYGILQNINRSTFYIDRELAGAA